MKTTEEIKKGLECCISDTYGCNEKCPYFNSLSNGVDCAVKMHADALAYIQQLEPHVPRWIPVEERLPEEGKNVLIFVKCMNNWWHTEVDWRIGGCWFNNAETDWNKITHWMALPEPPEEG